MNDWITPKFAWYLEITPNHRNWWDATLLLSWSLSQ